MDVVALRIAAGIVGLGLVITTLLSAVETLVLPRGVQGRMFRAVFGNLHRLIDLLTIRAGTRRRDQALALLAPVGLLLLPVLWLVTVWLGYTALFVAAGASAAWEALRLSGSSLLTLGFGVPDGVVQTLLAFSEATIGLGMLTLLIAYLPTMYHAFSEREAEVAMLEVRAGDPPTGVELLSRYRRIGRDPDLPALFDQWEAWFAQLDETHTSLAALPLFRSANADRSWVTASGAVLDAASLYLACIDHPPQPAANLCIRAGYTTLRRICDLYGLPYDPDPAPHDPVAISREEFDEARQQLATAGYQMVDDPELAWRHFTGWRVNYDQTLLSMAVVLDVPWAPWTADRSPLSGRPRMWRTPRRPAARPRTGSADAR